jgi:hypothetical protein
MDYEMDLCPEHSVIRVTVMAENVTLELAEEIYRHLLEVTSEGGPYAAIFDFSAAKRTSITTNGVRSFARHRPQAVPTGRKQVVVGTDPHIFGLARVFEMCADAIGAEFQVVHTLEEAYKIVEVRPEEFTECLTRPHTTP